MAIKGYFDSYRIISMSIDLKTKKYFVNQTVYSIGDVIDKNPISYWCMIDSATLIPGITDF